MRLGIVAPVTLQCCKHGAMSIVAQSRTTRLRMCRQSPARRSSAANVTVLLALTSRGRMGVRVTQNGTTYMGGEPGSTGKAPAQAATGTKGASTTSGSAFGKQACNADFELGEAESSLLSIGGCVAGTSSRPKLRVDGKAVW